MSQRSEIRDTLRVITSWSSTMTSPIVSREGEIHNTLTRPILKKKQKKNFALPHKFWRTVVSIRFWGGSVYLKVINLKVIITLIEFATIYLYYFLLFFNIFCIIILPYTCTTTIKILNHVVQTHFSKRLHILASHRRSYLLDKWICRNHPEGKR